MTSPAIQSNTCSANLRTAGVLSTGTNRQHGRTGRSEAAEADPDPCRHRMNCRGNSDADQPADAQQYGDGEQQAEQIAADTEVFWEFPHREAVEQQRNEGQTNREGTGPPPTGAGYNARQQMSAQRGQRYQKNRSRPVQDHAGERGRHHRPPVLEIDGGQILGMVAEVLDGSGIGPMGTGDVGIRLVVAEPGGEEAAGISAAGNRRQEVDVPEQAARRQHLGDAEAKYRRADAAAGKTEADGIAAIRSGGAANPPALPDLFGLRQIDGRDRFRRNRRMAAEAEHDILEAFFQLVRRHHLRCVNPRKFRAIGHVLQPDGEFTQDFLNVLQVAAKFIGAIARRQNPFFKGAVPFRRHRPQILVQHFGDGFGEYLAARIFLHGVARESEQLKQALQRAGLHAVLIGQWLGGDAGVQFREKLVSGGLVGVGVRCRRGRGLGHGNAPIRRCGHPLSCPVRGNPASTRPNLLTRGAVGYRQTGASLWFKTFLLTTRLI